MSSEASSNESLESVIPHPAFAHFRYPIGVPSEIVKAVHEAIKQEFGSRGDSRYLEWMRKLQRNGLI